MNTAIENYFAALEVNLIQREAIIAYEILRREVTPGDGKLRAKAALRGGDTLEFFVYVKETAGAIQQMKYSFHWQDSQGRLRRRWDNAPHHPDLPNAPHHVHEQDDTATPMTLIPDLFFVITQIEKGP